MFGFNIVAECLIAIAVIYFIYKSHMNKKEAEMQGRTYSASSYNSMVNIRSHSLRTAPGAPSDKGPI